eukprot:gene14920-6058_t
MAKDVKKKVRIKNGHKLVVKNTFKKTRDLLTPPGTNVDEETAIKLKSFQTTIQKKQEDIKNLNNEILELLTDCQKLPDSWELDELLGVFGEELNLREKCAFAPISGPSTTNTQEQKLRNFKTPATQGYQSTTSTLVSNVYPTQYIFCNKKHFSASCATVTDPTTRKNILGEKKRCFVCLRSGHLSRNCHSTGKCFHCGESHHAAICSSNSVRKHQREVFSSEASRGDTAPRVNTTEHKTYITISLRDSLQLSTMKTENVVIKEFGNQQGTHKECDVVQLAVRGDDNLTVYIYAYVVEVICSPLSSQVIQFAQEYYPHLPNLKLADQNTGLEDTEINLRIGADFFWSFMLDSVVRVEYLFGPVATLTRFGYVLSGPVPVHNSSAFSSNITISHVLKVETVSSKGKAPSRVIRDANVKVLGIPWDQNKDKLALNLIFFAHVATEERVTKRVVISTIAPFHDPLGIAAPTCVLLKQLFQEICKIKIGWDDCLPSKISIRFQQIVQESVLSIEFDRSLMKSINPNDVKAVEIHGFGDASIIALGACVYIRFLTFDDQQYNRYDKLLRITAIVLKFIKRLRGDIASSSDDIIDSEDLDRAKVLWHRTIQKSFKLDKKFSETKRHLKVIKDEQEVYRVSGRLDNAPIPFSTKFPVLLPRKHYFTELVIRKNHLIVKNNGTNETLTQIRTEYWICKCRQTVKTLLSKCVQCKRLMEKCYDTPGPPPLPGFRVSDDVAFSNIAVDFVGPLYVKNICSGSNET